MIRLPACVSVLRSVDLFYFSVLEFMVVIHSLLHSIS